MKKAPSQENFNIKLLDSPENSNMTKCGNRLNVLNLIKKQVNLAGTAFLQQKQDLKSHVHGSDPSKKVSQIEKMQRNPNQNFTILDRNSAIMGNHAKHTHTGDKKSRKLTPFIVETEFTE